MPIPRPHPDKIVPQPLKGELAVKVQMPDEMLQLARDAHEDRQAIGVGVVWVMVLLTALALRYVFRRTS